MRSLMKFSAIVALTAMIFGTGCGSDKGSSQPVLPDPVEDTAPPLAPTGLQSPKVDGHGFLLTWNDNTEPDIEGYRVYVYEPAPDRMQAYVLKNVSTLAPHARFVVNVGDLGPETWVRVTAVDRAGNESIMSEPYRVRGLTVAPGPGGSGPGAEEGETGGVILPPTRPNPRENTDRQPSGGLPG